MGATLLALLESCPVSYALTDVCPSYAGTAGVGVSSTGSPGGGLFSPGDVITIEFSFSNGLNEILLVNSNNNNPVLSVTSTAGIGSFTVPPGSPFQGYTLRLGNINGQSFQFSFSCSSGPPISPFNEQDEQIFQSLGDLIELAVYLHRINAASTTTDQVNTAEHMVFDTGFLPGPQIVAGPNGLHFFITNFAAEPQPTRRRKKLSMRLLMRPKAA